MSGNPWWREFRGSCSLSLPSLSPERRQMSPWVPSLSRGSSLALCEECMVCWHDCLHGTKAGCFDALPRRDGEVAGVPTSPSQGRYSSSQGRNLFLQSHRVDSDVMNQECLMSHFIRHSFNSLDKKEYPTFLVIWRTLNFLNLTKCSVTYSSFLPEFFPRVFVASFIYLCNVTILQKKPNQTNPSKNTSSIKHKQWE